MKAKRLRCGVVGAVVLCMLLQVLFQAPAQAATMTWNTFLGDWSIDRIGGIDLDSSGNVYVVGYSQSAWGFPVRAHSGGCDVFVAKINTNGDLIWNTFLGFGTEDQGYAIALRQQRQCLCDRRK